MARVKDHQRPPTPAAAGDLHSQPNIQADVIRADEVVSPTAVTPPWPVRKDSLITYLAIFVIGSAALCSVIVLFVQTFWPQLRPEQGDNWAIDMLTLALVSSLSFVMGKNSSEG